MRALILLLLLVSPLVLATTEKQVTAESWLNRLSKSLKSLNFSTSFVVVKNNQAEPYHWFHGVTEEGIELEILSLLNGPRRDILRKDNIVSYVEPELPPYSVLSNEVKGPIPNILSGDVDDLSSTYDFVSVGKSRVLGRGAQLVRIVPKDNHRFGHWLWLDSKTGMLLKLVVATKQGQLLEQIQFTHLDIADKPSESVSQLQNTDLPAVLEIPEGYQQQALSWKVNWLPDGFKSINTNRHRLSATKQAVEFNLFSDGLVDISVYVNPTRETQRATDFVFDGATVALNQVTNGMEVSVVGKIPSSTAKQIADSVTLSNGH